VANVAPTMSITAPGDYVAASFADVGTNDKHGNGSGSCTID
jgi:hypothetical protein